MNNYEIKNGIAGPIIIFKNGQKTEGYYDIPNSVLNLINNLQEENKQLKERVKYVEQINLYEGTYRSQQETKIVSSEYKIQRVIDRCKYLLENDKVEINGKTYYKQECDDVITKYILNVLETGE